uniref:Putative secreted protein n=1 Tax=Anopheles triannulatus TaxID=58253 RepID=A0A2M4B3R1_9DIPT
MQSPPPSVSFCFFTGLCSSGITSFSTASAPSLSVVGGALSVNASLDPLLSSTAEGATIGSDSPGCSLSLVTLEEDSR